MDDETQDALELTVEDLVSAIEHGQPADVSTSPRLGTDPNALNAAPCPNCGVPVVPAKDAECPVCLMSFADEHTWDHLR